MREERSGPAAAPPDAARPSERANQRYRTRKDLLLAAARLMKSGRRPTLDEVAEVALVSRATAYRYFPNIEALLVEAPLDLTVPAPETLFGADADGGDADPLERIARAEAAMHEAVFRNEAGIRMMLASAISRAGSAGADGLPVRQNRRMPLIEAALAPAREAFDDAGYARLCAALAIIFGSESMIVLRDVVRCDEATARNVKEWAVRALVEAALNESAGRQRNAEPVSAAGDRRARARATSPPRSR